MKDIKVSVTDHAIERWLQRASTYGDENAEDIKLAISESRLIPDEEALPFGHPRVPDTVYAFKDGVLFVLRPNTIDRWTLITIISEEPTQGLQIPKKKIKKKTEITARNGSIAGANGAVESLMATFLEPLSSEECRLRIVENENALRLLYGIKNQTSAITKLLNEKRLLKAWLKNTNERLSQQKQQRLEDLGDLADVIREAGKAMKKLKSAVYMLGQENLRLKKEIELLKPNVTES